MQGSILKMAKHSLGFVSGTQTKHVKEFPSSIPQSQWIPTEKNIFSEPAERCRKSLVGS
jgi:hypothetical protein